MHRDRLCVDLGEWSGCMGLLGLINPTASVIVQPRRRVGAGRRRRRKESVRARAKKCAVFCVRDKIALSSQRVDKKMNNLLPPEPMG